MKQQAPSAQGGRITLVALGIVLILLAYGSGSLAIDSGNWLHYLLTFLLLGFAGRLFIRAVRNK